MLFLFHAFSLFGWLLEMLVHLVQNGTFNNDTMFFAPWVPLYGLFGHTLPCTHEAGSPEACACICGMFRSIFPAGIYFKLSVRPSSRLPIPDYSGFLLNLNGRIYPGGSAVFALLGCGFIYFLAPKWAEQFEKGEVF